MANVTVGCRLPNGIIIQHPENPNIKALIIGINKAQIIGASYVSTPVDEDLWNAWIAVHADFPAIKNGSLFVAKNNTEAKVVAKEFEDEKTGLEPVKPDSLGVKTAKE